MQTAAWIASTFGITEVTINWTLTQHLSRDKVHYYNPMDYLEFTRANFDFQKLKASNEQYYKDSFFPQEVNIVDPGDCSLRYRKVWSFNTK